MTTENNNPYGFADGGDGEPLSGTRGALIDSMIADGLCRQDAESCLDELIDAGVVREYVDGTLRIASITTALRYRARLATTRRWYAVKRAFGLSADPDDVGWDQHQNVPQCLAGCPYADECSVALQLREDRSDGAGGSRDTNRHD